MACLLAPVYPFVSVATCKLVEQQTATLQTYGDASTRTWRACVGATIKAWADARFTGTSARHFQLMRRGDSIFVTAVARKEIWLNLNGGWPAAAET